MANMVAIKHITGHYDKRVLTPDIVRANWGERAYPWVGSPPTAGFGLERHSVDQVVRSLNVYVNLQKELDSAGFDHFYIGLDEKTDMRQVWELQELFGYIDHVPGRRQYPIFQMQGPNTFSGGKAEDFGLHITPEELRMYANHGIVAFKDVPVIHMR